MLAYVRIGHTVRQAVYDNNLQAVHHTHQVRLATIVAHSITQGQ